MFNFSWQGRTNAKVPDNVLPATRDKRRQLLIHRLDGHNERDFEELPTFGPLYSTDESPILKAYKEGAWEHVLNSTVGDDLETTESYLSAIGDVEREALACYADVSMVKSETEFRWMMLKDGCFLIQLAILVLGGSSGLGYHTYHSIFGTSKKVDMKRWINSMFYFGNQIPLVVLWKLMEQPFFRKVLEATELEEPTGIFRRVLYELLFIPFIRKKNPSLQITASQGPVTTISQFSDLLHGFHSLVTGTSNQLIEDHGEHTIDLELGDGEYVDDDNEFLSATKLYQAGIRFENRKGIGCNEIQFESGRFRSVLFMPNLVVDDHTELMFQYLKRYEKAHQLNKQKQVVCAYLKFMSELVRTKEDVRLLASKGIITADSVHRDKLPAILSRLAHSESTQSLQHLRLQINDYSQPAWRDYIGIITIGFLLTVVQTTFGILSYVNDIKP